MAKITTETSHKLLAVLQELGWDEVDDIGARELIRNPELARKLFAEFIDRGVPSEFLTSFDPKEQIGKGWRINPNPHALKSVTGEFDRRMIEFKNMILPEEPFLPTNELIRRLRDAGEVCFGIDGFVDLWNDRANLPEEWARTESGLERIILFVADELTCNGHGVLPESAFIALHKNESRWLWSPYNAEGRIIPQAQVAVLKPAVSTT